MYLFFYICGGKAHCTFKRRLYTWPRDIMLGLLDKTSLVVSNNRATCLSHARLSYRIF